MSRVSVSISNHIAEVTLTRGDKMNALDIEMIEALVAAGESLRGHNDVRAVVLSAEGKAFCAGLDVANFARFAQTDPEELIMPRTHGAANLFQQVSLIWRELPVPVIAALHGVCFGGGLQIALGADIRIAHPDTQLSIMEMKWGLIPDMGGMVVLPKLLRADHLRQLTYTASPIDASKAQDIGLVTDLSQDPRQAAHDLAAQIALKSPSAIQAAKRLIDLAETTNNEAEILTYESRFQTDLVGKPHQMEAIMANMQKRPPVFK
ncbi:MAG: crotonase/enoyl-CoA hydratase family protein [Thalassovita sp.]